MEETLATCTGKIVYLSKFDDTKQVVDSWLQSLVSSKIIDSFKAYYFNDYYNGALQVSLVFNPVQHEVPTHLTIDLTRDDVEIRRSFI